MRKVLAATSRPVQSRTAAVHALPACNSTSRSVPVTEVLQKLHGVPLKHQNHREQTHHSILDSRSCFYSAREVLAATPHPVQPLRAAVCALSTCNSILEAFCTRFSPKPLPQSNVNTRNTQNTSTKVLDGGRSCFCSAREVPGVTLERSTTSQSAISAPWPCTSKRTAFGASAHEHAEQ